MRSEVEARYLSVEWADRGQARRVEVAPEPIELEDGPDGTTIETVMFHDVHPWLGLRLTGEAVQERPAFVTPAGERRPMLAVADVQGRTWWVQDDGWDAERRRHLSELHRSPGRFEIRVGDRTLFVDNDAGSSGRAQLEEYLRDFQGDLFWLLMNFGGGTAARATPMAGTELAEAIGRLAAAAHHVFRRPAVALREVLVEAPAMRVRPNADTFRQHARNPTAPRLVGRGTVETPDTAENRYTRHMVQHALRLASAALLSAERQADALQGRAKREARDAIRLRNKTHLCVDPEAFDDQVAKLEEKLAPLSSYRDGRTAGQGRKAACVVGIRGPHGDDKGVVRFDNLEEDAREREFQGIDYDLLAVSEPLAKLLLELVPYSRGHTLHGLAETTNRQFDDGKPYRLVAFSQVVSVMPHALSNRRSKREALAKQGWKRRLRPRELDEVRTEAKTAQQRERVYREHAQGAERSAERLTAAAAKLRWLDREWAARNVRPRSLMPTGMLFSRHPDYAACLSAFLDVRRVAERSGVDAAALDAVERVGILNASALYERWCLVKIIQVLVEDFRFLPQADWHEHLIRGVTGVPEHNLALELAREDGQFFATLEVQPVLANGKRPDFRLTFHRSPASNGRSGLVMDAKFRMRWRPGELSSTVDELIRLKGYDEDGSRVFVLHPVPHAMPKGNSSLEWGRHCDYGHASKTNHRRGAIYLAPAGDASGPAAHLRRLIALELQATFARPEETEDGAGWWESESFCVRCGGRHRSMDIEASITEKRKPFWRLRCSACKMMTVRTHCWYCGRTLFKNGLHLTYHWTNADHLSNIICPSCEQGL